MTSVKPWLTASWVLFLGLGLAADARAQAGPAGEGLPACVKAAKWSSDPIPGQDLWSAGGPGGFYVAAKTNAGNLALLKVSALDTFVIETSQLFNAAGTLIAQKEYLRIPGGSAFDLDTGTESSDTTADLKWNAGRGAKSLQPLNNAMVYACRPSDRQATPK